MHFLVKNEGPSIDKARLLPREDAVSGWLLSTSTTIFSKMDLSYKPLPALPSRCVKNPLNSRIPIRPAVSSLNYAKTAKSTFSNDRNMEQDMCRSGPDSIMEDPKLSGTDCWDSYFWSHDKENIPSPLHQAEFTFTSPFRQEPILSQDKRNFAFANLSELNTGSDAVALQRSDATRKPRRLPKSLPINTYSPFPHVSTQQRQPSLDSAHNSWPLNSVLHSQKLRTSRPVLRPRACTAPLKYAPLSPSNLSTCSTLNDHDSPCPSTTSSASALYMRSAPVSPDFAPPLMDLMEKSYFEEDSDDEWDEEGRLAAIAVRLHIRSASSTSHTSGERKERGLSSQKSRKNLRIASEKFKGILGMRKSSEAI